MEPESCLAVALTWQKGKKMRYIEISDHFAPFGKSSSTIETTLPTNKRDVEFRSRLESQTYILTNTVLPEALAFNESFFTMVRGSVREFVCTCCAMTLNLELLRIPPLAKFLRARQETTCKNRLFANFRTPPGWLAESDVFLHSDQLTLTRLCPSPLFTI